MEGFHILKRRGVLPILPWKVIYIWRIHTTIFLSATRIRRRHCQVIRIWMTVLQIRRRHCQVIRILTAILRIFRRHCRVFHIWTTMLQTPHRRCRAIPVWMVPVSRSARFPSRRRRNSRAIRPRAAVACVFSMRRRSRARSISASAVSVLPPTWHLEIFLPIIALLRAFAL